VIPLWMLDAATELSALDEVNADGPEDWHFDLDNETASLPECDDFDFSCEWSFSQCVRTLTCTSGRASITCYPEPGADIKDEARRLMRGMEAFWA